MAKAFGTASKDFLRSVKALRKVATQLQNELGPLLTVRLELGFTVETQQVLHFRVLGARRTAYVDDLLLKVTVEFETGLVKVAGVSYSPGKVADGVWGALQQKSSRIQSCQALVA